MAGRLSCFMYNVSEAGKSAICLIFENWSVPELASSLAAAAHHEGRPDHTLHARPRLLVHAPKRRKDAANSATVSRLSKSYVDACLEPQKSACCRFKASK